MIGIKDKISKFSLKISSKSKWPLVSTKERWKQEITFLIFLYIFYIFSIYFPTFDICMLLADAFDWDFALFFGCQARENPEISLTAKSIVEKYKKDIKPRNIPNRNYSSRKMKRDNKDSYFYRPIRKSLNFQRRFRGLTFIPSQANFQTSKNFLVRIRNLFLIFSIHWKWKSRS